MHLLLLPVCHIGLTGWTTEQFPVGCTARSRIEPTIPDFVSNHCFQAAVLTGYSGRCRTTFGAPSLDQKNLTSSAFKDLMHTSTHEAGAQTYRYATFLDLDLPNQV